MQIEVEFDYEIFLPKYRPLVDSTADRIVLWGGRDSGKSHFIAQALVKECLENEYFKCILNRKVQDTIKESQWATIKSVVEELGLEDMFDFYSSPLEIRCGNGNKFICRGADQFGKSKGIKDPTHAWFEEMNQITFQEYSVISTTLRSSKTKTKEYWSFNPECDGDFKEFWLYQIVGENYSDHREVRRIDVDGVEIEVVYEFVHGTYNDNPYCPPERKANYLNTVKGDTYLYDVWIHGYWGAKEVKRPFCFNFNYEKHVSPVAVFRSHIPVKISIDFNRQPFTAVLSHLWADSDGYHLHIFKEIGIDDGSIEEMAKQIVANAGNLYSIEITGDASGRAGRVKIYDADNNNLFTALKFALGISEKQIRVVNKNPRHKESRDNYNLMLAHFPDFKIHPSCVNTIRDHRTVEIDIEGKIIKSNRNIESQRADFIDCCRYLENTYLYDWRKRYQVMTPRK
jgi:PBSX family phage terminase large subunit